MNLVADARGDRRDQRPVHALRLVADAAAISGLLAGFMLGALTIAAAIYGGATLLFMTVGLMASYLPARRAAAIAPMVALGYE